MPEQKSPRQERFFFFMILLMEQISQFLNRFRTVRNDEGIIHFSLLHTCSKSFSLVYVVTFHPINTGISVQEFSNGSRKLFLYDHVLATNIILSLLQKFSLWKWNRVLVSWLNSCERSFSDFVSVGGPQQKTPAIPQVKESRH